MAMSGPHMLCLLYTSNLEANMAKTWQYMTEEERARYSQGGFNACLLYTSRCV